MKQQIENIIKENLPEKKEITCDLPHIIKMCEKCEDDTIFNQALSQINTSLIADEVLKVVVEEIREEIKNNVAYGNFGFSRMDFKHEGQIAINMNDILQLLSNLSPNKENKDNG